MSDWLKRPGESANDYVALRAELERGGYREIPEIDGIKPGDRVRSYGEQYSEAHRSGTAMALAVMCSDRLIQGRPDIEIIVERDNPWLPGMSRVTNWAGYHTCAVDR